MSASSLLAKNHGLEASDLLGCQINAYKKDPATGIVRHDPRVCISCLHMTDDLLARAEMSGSPVQILESLFCWASSSIVGFSVLLCSITGYFLGVVFILCALLKPLHPQNAGLWIFHDGAGNPSISLRLGFGGTLEGGHDVMGWWIVPVGLVAGCGLVMLITRFALWCVSQYRKSHLVS